MKRLYPLIFLVEAFAILWLLEWLLGMSSDSESLFLRFVHFLAYGVWFFLPSWISNGPPGLVQSWNILNYPMDFGRNWKDGKRILGNHKTVRGFIAGTLGGMFVGFLQGRLFEGLVLGFSAMLGDAVKSFFKRRSNIDPGGRFTPWDRVDFLLGSCFVYALFFPSRIENLRYAIAVLILVFPIHEISDRVAVFIGIKENPW